MDQDNILLYLSRILSGSYYFIHNNQKYKLVYPDISVKYQAELHCQEQMQKNRFNDWILDEDIVHYLVGAGIWDYTGDDLLKKIEKQIEDIKIDLFKNFLNPTKIKSLKRSLDNTKRRYDSMYAVRHSFDHLTHQGYASILKNQYILANSIYDDKNCLIFDSNDFSKIDLAVIDSITEEIGKSSIDIKTFRKIARSDIWRNYWSANKDYLFDKPAVNWTDEQRTLVVLTKMYDSSYENPDCPPDDVFEDDDIFDGWMIMQRRESEKNKSKNRTEKMIKGKGLDRANEVFIVANSKEEAQAIYDLNDDTNMHIIRERNSVILNSQKELKEAELPDVQRNIVAESNRQFMQSRKGKK